MSATRKSLHFNEYKLISLIYDSVFVQVHVPRNRNVTQKIIFSL